MCQKTTYYTQHQNLAPMFFYVYLTDGQNVQLAAPMHLAAWPKRACSRKAMPPNALKPGGFCPIRGFIQFFVKAQQHLSERCAQMAGRCSGLSQEKGPAPLRRECDRAFRVMYNYVSKTMRAYFTSIWRAAFCTFCSSLGRSTVSTPSATLAAIFSLSTSSGRMSVCSNFE